MKKMRDLGKEVNLDIKVEEIEQVELVMVEEAEQKVAQDASAEQIVPLESNPQKDQTNELTPPK